MSRRVRVLTILGLAVGLMVIALVWRSTQEGEFVPSSSLVQPPAQRASLPASPLTPPSANAFGSPLSTPATAPLLINAATLEAIRATRPTATPPSLSGIRLPYIAPQTWRNWAMWILAAAGVLAYIALRLRQSQ